MTNTQQPQKEYTYILTWGHNNQLKISKETMIYSFFNLIIMSCSNKSKNTMKASELFL